MAEPAAPVAITGLSVVSAFGRGIGSLRDGVYAGAPAFGCVSRFDTDRYRSRVAATLPGNPTLADELVRVTDEACDEAGLSAEERSRTPLLLALHPDPALARTAGAAAPGDVPTGGGAGAAAVELARRCGLGTAPRTYTAACVAASTAVADAAAMIVAGRAGRVVVAAGYLVDEDYFALFDSGRALADDGQLRPFSGGRRGLLLGDGVGAVMLESAAAAHLRGVAVLGRLVGWGRAGDAYHVCQPHPAGVGMARAIQAALTRADAHPADVSYVNAHGTGTSYNDWAESAALGRAFGRYADTVPVSSTKALHGHALEASGLVELAVTVLALRTGKLPVNAGYLGPDERCRLNLVLGDPREAAPGYALSLNAAFGGANTALLIGAA